MANYSPDQTAWLVGAGLCAAMLLLTFCNRADALTYYPPDANKHRLQRRVVNLTGLAQKEEDAVQQHVGVQHLTGSTTKARHPITTQLLDNLGN